MLEALWKAFIDVDNDEKSSLFWKIIPNSRIECKTIPYLTKMATIDTLFLTKTAKPPYPLGPHILL